MSRRSKVAFGLTLAAVVILPGLANAFLASQGYDHLGSLVWAFGYGTGAVMIWFLWIRPLDIHAPESFDGAGEK